MLLDSYQIISSKNFEQIDMEIYECKAAAVIWENNADILVTAWKTCPQYGYDDLAVIQYAKQANGCLDWIEKNKAYIQKTVVDKTRFKLEYGFELKGKNFVDRLSLKKISIEICDEDITQELSACIHMEVSPFLFHGHCHRIVVVIYEQEDGMYRADILETTLQLLSEIGGALKEQNAEARKWAENHEIFYAFDDENNMLAVAKRQLGLSVDGKLISETDDDGNLKKEFSGKKLERSALYFIGEKWQSEGIPMPLGFVTEKLICKKGVFTIMSSSGHKAISGTFLVIHEALTMIEMLYRTRGVAEEEIDKCYYTFLVEDHQNYIDKNYGK